MRLAGRRVLGHLKAMSKKLSRRFAVAPMIEWNEDTISSDG
jgi:hypothetical protein